MHIRIEMGKSNSKTVSNTGDPQGGFFAPNMFVTQQAQSQQTNLPVNTHHFLRSTTRAAYSINVTATNFVYLRADVSDTPLTFMVDSGSDISVVKCNKLKLNQQFYPTHRDL